MIDLWLLGDTRERLRELAPGSVHTCVTSPPYWGLRDYGVAGQLGLEPTFPEYVANMVDVFREVRRVLRDDGTLWLNLGDSYAASAGARTFGDSKTFKGPPLSGTSQFVRDPNNAPRTVPDGLKPKDLVGIPWRVAFALQADGWYLRSDIIWHKPNPMPESVTDRPTKAHEYLFLLTKSERYAYDADAIREPHKPESLARYEYGLKLTPDPDAIKGSLHDRVHAGIGNAERMGDFVNEKGRNRRSVWTVPTHPFPEAHFATMPPALAEPCVLAGSPVGGVVLDPFGGAGTTALVARRLGRRFVYIDLNPDYRDIARRRVEGETWQVPLIGGVAC